MSKKLAVLLVNWNSYQLTADCIGSLHEMQYTNYDIIVIDNASADQSGPLLKETFPHILLIQAGDNLGFSGANNLGMQYAIDQGYEYLLLLNNDTFVKHDFLEPLVSYMDTHPETGAIQPLIYCNHNREKVWNGGSYYNRWLGYTRTANYHKPLQSASNKIQKVDWITGCAFFTRASVLQITGLLSTNMFMYYEDVDLSFRIHKAGFELIYQPKSVIYHIAGVSNKSKTKGPEGYLTPLIHYLNVRNRIWLLKKYSFVLYAPTIILFNILFLFAQIAYFLIRFRFAKLNAVLRGIKDGLKGEIKL